MINIWPSRELPLAFEGRNKMVDFSDNYENRVTRVIVKRVMEGFPRATLMTDYPIYQVSDGLDCRVFVVTALGADAYADGQVLLKVSHECGRGRRPLIRLEVGAYPTREVSSTYVMPERVTISKAEKLLRTLEAEIRALIPDLVASQQTP
jgi:hypothetical protein